MSREEIEQQIRDWEKEQKNVQTNERIRLFEKWTEDLFHLIPIKDQETFFQHIDQWLFHTHALLQNVPLGKHAVENVLQTGKIFNTDIRSVEDMKQLSIDQLTYIAKDQISSNRWISIIQGGLTGTGRISFVGLDLPLAILINLRLVYVIGSTFGYEMRKPYEMMIALKVFHAASLPKRLQSEAWASLQDELTLNHHGYMYEGDEHTTNVRSMHQPLRQIVKNLFLIRLRNKKTSRFPFIRVGVSAYLNDQLTYQVGEFTLRFYQKRFLTEERR
ncbi:EcsC family protein [Aquibacillus sp. 3ASR75-11]|uniref:EcsC family protein n=1 Tax=Terrihalobacillus insolitus TaxID=2950438 RepID=A0A9X3WST2_9BACI|nr:EcsC family protein [Terrihalobacillus insolitus]MDC3412658.1 EcsC family protein [Terrihalobacillus insolitus]MDC3424008.1 EcsC family protein [Terrihalobacillus insolitus]